MYGPLFSSTALACKDDSEEDGAYESYLNILKTQNNIPEDG